MAYFDSILMRYETLRAQLSQIPPAEAIRKLGKDNPTHVGKLNTEVARWWRWKMRTVDPSPVQIACMGKSTVLRLLGLLTGGTLLKKGAEVEVGVSRWAWGLLARLPERGELTSEEIGVVRELGKKAVLVGMGLREDKQWEEGINEVEAGFAEDDEFAEDTSYLNEEEISLDVGDEFDDIRAGSTKLEEKAPMQQIGPQLPNDVNDSDKANEEITIEAQQYDSMNKCSDAEFRSDNQENGQSATTDEIVDEFAAAKARILAKLNEQDDVKADQTDVDQAVPEDGDNPAQMDREASKWNSRATVDMIITVAGEIFGQRDLLEFRTVWGEVK